MGRHLRKSEWTASMLVALAFAPAANANAAASMMMSTLTHLFLGGAVLGVIEACVVTLVWKTRWWKSVLMCTLANYVSSWIGVIVTATTIHSVREWLGRPLMDTAPILLGVTLVVGLLISWISEWPLIHLAFPSGQRAWKSTLRAALLAQLASYPLLALLYGVVCSLSLYTTVTRDHTLSFVPRDLEAWVYYVEKDSGAIMRIRLNGQSRERIADPGPKGPADRLFVVRSAGGKFDLWRTGGPSHSQMCVIEDFAELAAIDELELAIPPEPVSASPRRESFDLRPPDDREWTVEGHWRPEGGLVGRHRDGREVRVACSIPFLSTEFSSMNPTVLPHSLVVYQLGSEWEPGWDDSVVVLDLERRRIGRLAAGRSPIVGLQRSEED